MSALLVRSLCLHSSQELPPLFMNAAILKPLEIKRASTCGSLARGCLPLLRTATLCKENAVSALLTPSLCLSSAQESPLFCSRMRPCLFQARCRLREAFQATQALLTEVEIIIFVHFYLAAIARVCDHIFQEGTEWDYVLAHCSADLLFQIRKYISPSEYSSGCNEDMKIS